MSLYFSPSEIDVARLEMVARELARERDKVIVRPGAGGFIWVGRQPDRFGPAFDEKTGVRALSSGHSSWSASQWATAKQLPYDGGLANRIILERYLSGGIETVAPYNGSTALVIHDPRSAQTHVLTDQFGYHPCFVYHEADASRLIITTFPDALLADPAVVLTWDFVSMAEFYRAWRITPPNTYYREVKYAGASMHIKVDNINTTVERATYWEPFQDEFYPSIEVAAEALANAVRIAIEERSAIAERPVFFVSGGADSRVLLFSISDPARVSGVHIFEYEGAEPEVARKLCENAGCRYIGLQRDNDYYPRNMPEVVRWSGAMWSTDDAHYPGFEDQIAEIDPDLVMTACTTDWLFKGYGLEKEYMPFLGRNLPFLRFRDQRVDGFLPNVPTPPPPDMADEIDARMAVWFAGCSDNIATPLERLRVEDRRVRPACYTVSVSGQIMYRIFPYDTFLADSRVAECYSRIQPDWKLNREVWGKAAALICAGAGNVVDSNYGWRVDANMREKAIVFAKGWIRRRIAKPNGSGAALAVDRPPPSGSWPDYGWYAEHSATLRAQWDSITSEERERMQMITGHDHWAEPIERWRNNGAGLFRLMTLLNHWRQVGERRQRAKLGVVRAA